MLSRVEHGKSFLTFGPVHVGVVHYTVKSPKCSDTHSSHTEIQRKMSIHKESADEMADSVGPGSEVIKLFYAQHN